MELTRKRTATPERRVWLLAGMMALAAAALAAPRFIADPAAAVPDLSWAVLLPFFALAEILVIHLPAQRSSHSHTLREIPAIAGLTFLAPGQYITVYVIGGGLALLLWSHQRGLKLGFNLAMFSLEAVLGSLAYHAVLGSESPIDLRAWAAAVAAVLVTDLVSAAAVTAAISITEQKFDETILREALRFGIPAAMVNTCVALLLVTLVVARPSALPLLAAIVVLLMLGYRFYVSLARGHVQTQMLYRFVGSTGHLSELNDVVPAVLSEAAELLQATRSQLVDVSSGRCVTWENAAFTSAYDVPSQPWWRGALEGRSVLRSEELGSRAEHNGQDNPRNGMAVPLSIGEEVFGVLIISDRTFEEETYGPDDLQLFETLAAHAAVTLDKARVVDRLRNLVAEREAEALADPLTGLPNRQAFRQAVDTAMADGNGAVLLLDLVDFKDVNDTLGHTAGDELLVVTGERLQADAPHFMARLGGDEFAVLLPGASVAEATDYARHLQQVSSVPVPLLGVTLTTSASIGVARYQGNGCTSEEILGQADVAMYAAKRAKSGVEVYRPEDGISTARRLKLAADLPVALTRSKLELWYQPQADSDTGRVSGFEALLRWRHPDFGMVPPPEIIAVAQRTGLMRALTDEIIVLALRERSRWAEHGYDLDISVNVTPRDVADEVLVERVTEALRRTGTAPHALTLEITETDAMGNLEHSLTILRALAAHGVRLSVDDFGTGYSSLAYLDQLPVHEVKIDQSFISRLELEEADPTIVRATVALAHDLGLQVVAEGVENELARSVVTDMGCDLYQGYGLARPMPAAAVITWLGRHQARTTRTRPHITAVRRLRSF